MRFARPSSRDPCPPWLAQSHTVMILEKWVCLEGIGRSFVPSPFFNSVHESTSLYIEVCSPQERDTFSAIFCGMLKSAEHSINNQYLLFWKMAFWIATSLPVPLCTMEEMSSILHGECWLLCLDGGPSCFGQ